MDLRIDGVMMPTAAGKQIYICLFGSVKHGDQHYRYKTFYEHHIPKSNIRWF